MSGDNADRIHIKGLGALRTLAIFGIIFYHMYPYDYKGGFLGVSLFFMLSGYLIAIHSEEQRKARVYSIPKFYINRIKRLYPQLVISIFVTAGIFHFVMPRILSGSKGEAASIIFGYNNFWQISQSASYFERIANSSPFTHMWSLSNEVQFYLIWPIIFFWFIFFTIALDVKRAIRYLLILAIIASALMPVLFFTTDNVTRLYYGMDTRMFSFIIGAWLGMRRFHYGNKDTFVLSNKLGWAAFGVLFAILMVAYFLVDGAESYTYLGVMFASNIVYALMIRLCANENLTIGDFLEKRVFDFFGKISYEMYLWMYPIIFVFTVMRWNRIPGAPIIMIFVIIIMSLALHSIVNMIKNKDYSMKGDFSYKMRKLAMLVVTVLFAGAFAVGGCSVVTSSSSHSAEDDELKADLAKNAKALQNQNLSENTANTSETEHLQETEEPQKDLFASMTAVGDSVMLGAALKMQEIMPNCYVDAAESRQTRAAMDILESIAAQGNLGDTVILGLGTNGVIGESVGQSIIDYLGEDRTIFWVNVYGETLQWMDDANDVIDNLVKNNDNVYLIDWASIADANREWLYDDGIHLRPEGQEGYAAFLYASIEEINSDFNQKTIEIEALGSDPDSQYGKLLKALVEEINRARAQQGSGQNP